MENQVSLNVKTKKFIEFLESKRRDSWTTVVYMKPQTPEFSHISIFLSPKKRNILDIWVFIHVPILQNSIAYIGRHLDYPGLQKFLLDHKIRRVKLIEVL